MDNIQFVGITQQIPINLSCKEKGSFSTDDEGNGLFEDEDEGGQEIIFSVSYPGLPFHLILDKLAFIHLPGLAKSSERESTNVELII